MKSVLISGASVAGPALAYWLHRYGFHVTVVERSAEIRGGGYPIDIRGTAVDVVERMGVLPQLQARHIDTRRISAVDAAGRTIASFSPGALAGAEAGRDLEVPRGDLTSVLYALTEDKVEYVFGDSIATLTPHDDGVDVTFERGEPRSFDLVVGADGLHSTTRRLAFGPEADYHHYLGYCFAGFTAPNPTGLSHEAILQNTPGRLTALYAVGEQPWVHALLAFVAPEPPREKRGTDTVELVSNAFAGMGGETPRLLEELKDAKDVYFDTVSQIRMPSWVAGRVALVGDAAYAPSFLTGQGTSLALSGAYVLAGQIANGDLAGYERIMRPYVEQNQALVSGGGSSILPRTRGRLWMRNQSFKLLPLLARTNVGRGSGRRAAAALTLPTYAS